MADEENKLDFDDFLSESNLNPFIGHSGRGFITPNPEGINDIDSLSLEDQEYLQILERYKQDTNEKRKYSVWAKKLVSWYLIIVLCLILLTGFYPVTCFYISDTVIVATLTTAMANILGITYIVVKGYFGNGEP